MQFFLCSLAKRIARNHSWPQMFRQIPRRTPFLGAETPLPCVLGRRLGFPPSLAPAAKTAGFLREEIPGDILAGPAAADFRIRTGKNRLTVKGTIRAGFSSKRSRKGKRLVQEHPVNGWIWCSWNERQTWGARSHRKSAAKSGRSSVGSSPLRTGRVLRTSSAGWFPKKRNPSLQSESDPAFGIAPVWRLKISHR